MCSQQKAEAMTGAFSTLFSKAVSQLNPELVDKAILTGQLALGNPVSNSEHWNGRRSPHHPLFTQVLGYLNSGPRVYTGALPTGPSSYALIRSS